MISLLLPIALTFTQVDGKAILSTWEAKLKAAKTLSGRLEIDGGPYSDKIDFQLMKPNLGKSISKDTDRICDGVMSFDFDREKKTYLKMKATGMPFVSTLFLGFEAYNDAESDFDYKGAAPAKFDGEDVTALTMALKAGHLLIVGFTRKGGPPVGITGGGYTIKMYFRDGGQILCGFELDMGDQTIKGAYKDLKFNEAMDPKSFVWTPPKGAKETKIEGMDDLEAKLLPVGSKAPDFTLKTQDGKSVKLSEYVKDKKATLLNFWYWGCAGCLIEYPHLDKLYKSKKDQGLGLLTLNLKDDANTVKKYHAEGKFGLTCLLMKDAKQDVPKLYGVEAYPTNYIVDKNMKILYRATGEYMDNVQAALAKAGIR